MRNLWYRAQHAHIQASSEIAGDFDIGFDARISEETKTELRNFVNRVEQNYYMGTYKN